MTFIGTLLNYIYFCILVVANCSTSAYFIHNHLCILCILCIVYMYIVILPVTVASSKISVQVYLCENSLFMSTNITFNSATVGIHELIK